jgi:hypothetical protein
MVEVKIRITAFIILSIALSALITDICSSESLQQQVEKMFPIPSNSSSSLYNNTHSAIRLIKDYQKTSSVVVSGGIASLVVLSPVK